MLNMGKKFKFEPSGDYYKDLGMRESSGEYGAVNKSKFLGLYQMGEAALVDVGYYKKLPEPGKKNPVYNNSWTGTWSGKNGINSQEDFLSNKNAQDIAVREYHKIIWERYLKNYHRYEGETIAGIKLSKAGMISAAHLVGHAAIKKFIDSKGQLDAQDANSVRCSDYLRDFFEYKIDYDSKLKEEFKKSLEEKKTKIHKSIEDKTKEATSKLKDDLQKEFDKVKEEIQKNYDEKISTKAAELQAQLDEYQNMISIQKQQEHDTEWQSRAAAFMAAHNNRPPYGINSDDIVSRKLAEAKALIQQKEQECNKELQEFKDKELQESQKLNSAGKLRAQEKLNAQLNKYYEDELQKDEEMIELTRLVSLSNFIDSIGDENFPIFSGDISKSLDSLNPEA